MKKPQRNTPIRHESNDSVSAGQNQPNELSESYSIEPTGHTQKLYYYHKPSRAL